MGHPPRLARAVALLFGCLLLLFAVDSISADKCHTGCHGMHSDNAYKEGHTYVYQLAGESRTLVTGEPEVATVELKATVELSVKPDCIHQLKLKNVLVNGAAAASSDVGHQPLQFNYHSGHIDSQVCAEPSDTQASLNIKRAVISLFQSAALQKSSPDMQHETDIFGVCPTYYTSRKEGDKLFVEKQKHLDRCSHRENFKNGLVSAVFGTKSEIKTSLILDSKQTIDQEFKQGVLNKASSKEVYVLEPFSKVGAEVKTIVETTLTFKEELSESVASDEVSLPKSLLFEVPHPVVRSSIEALNSALEAASKEEIDSMQPNAAGAFADLVKVLRISSKNDILSVYHKVKSGAGHKANDKRLFLEALLRSGSSEAAEVAVELIKNNELPQDRHFYATLAFVRHVNLPAVTAVTSLLNQPELPRLAYTGIGQVIGKYCQKHQCENVQEVKQAVHKIREKVGNGKSKTRSQENVIVAALKALGNAYFLDDATLQKLATIAADKNVRNRVRVAAIEALPTRCSMKWKNTLLNNVLADREEDDEVRIKAYLALVACPCPHVANRLKEIIDQETVNQVGSFITSHLRNLRASADPNKREAQRQLGLIKPRQKFPEDFRKYSFNNELSYSLDTYGAGSSVESNVIYSQNSFVPRSVSLNLTTEIFGHSFNFLELNARVENLDRIIEHYFGPKGEFSKTELNSLLKGIPGANDITEHIKERLDKIRGKREVKQAELDKFAKNVKLRGNEVDKALNLDLSMKMFGVEVGYLNYQTDVEKLNLPHAIDKLFNTLEQGMDELKDFDYNLDNHLNFIDAMLVYPTSLGFPLSLGVTGTSAVRINAKTKIDIPAIIKDPKNAAIRIALEPSASIRVAANMVVEALGTDSGVNFITTMHTSTGSDVSVKLLDGSGFDVSFGLPKKSQKIITLSNDIVYTSGQKNDKHVVPKANKAKEYSDCFDQLSSLLGLTVCGQFLLPYDNIESLQKKPFSLLSKPSKLSLNIENNDVSSYYFKVYYDKKQPKARSLEILLETPNSKTNRRVSLTFEGSLEPDKLFKVALDSPIKKASAMALYKSNPKERTLQLGITHDQMEFYIRTGIVAVSDTKYKPILQYKVPENIEKLVGGKSDSKAVEQNGQQYNVEGTVDVVGQNGDQEYVFENVHLTSGDRKIFGLNGRAKLTPSTVLVDMKVLGSGSHMEEFALVVNGQKIEDKKYAFSVSVAPQKNRDFGFNLKWELDREPTELSHKLVFIHGPDLNSKTNRLTLEQHAIYKPNSKDFVISSTNKLTYPAINALLKLDGKVTRKSLDWDVEVKYNDFKFGTELSGKIDTSKPGDYGLEFGLELAESSLEFKSSRAVIDVNRKSKYQNSLELSPNGGKYEANAVITHEFDKNHVNFQLDGALNLNSKSLKVEAALEANPPSLNSRAVVTFVDVTYLEFNLKGHGGSEPHGNLNLNLKNYVNAIGQFTKQSGKVNGRLNVDFPKLNRKIKGTVDLTISGTKYDGNMELLYDAEKDPSKSIKITTLSDITENSVDTKNVIEVLSKKIELNGKGTLQGTISDGVLAVDADITLPCGRYIVCKGKRKSVKKDKNEYDVEANAELLYHEKKDSPPAPTLTYTGTGTLQDKNLKSLNAKCSYVDKEGKDVVIELKTKNLVEDKDKKYLEIDADVSGSKIPKALKLSMNSNCNKEHSKGQIKTSLGTDLVFTGSGSFSLGNNVDKPYKLDSELELKLPSEKLQNIKLQSSYSILIPLKIDGFIDYSSSNVLTYNNDKNVKLEVDLKCTNSNFGALKTSEGKLGLTILELPPILIEHTGKQESQDKMTTTSGKLNLKYGEKSGTIDINSAYLSDLSSIDLLAKATTPFEKLSTIELKLKHDKEDNNRQTDIVLIVEKSKYTLNSKVQEGPTAPMIHVTFTCPNEKTELLAKFQKLDDKDYKGEWLIDTPKGFVKADARVSLESVDNFLINVNFDSDKIQHRKIHAEIANKPTAKAGKRILITVTSDGKNLVTGSTNYKKREEEGKLIVEGNGSLMIGENTRSSSFKYTRQQLTHEADGEVGVAIVLNANFGPSAIVSESKFTNREVHVFNSYCEQSKDCAHFKLQSSVDTDRKTYLDHQIKVEVDLRKFNVPAEFGLQTSTQFNESLLDHTASLFLHSSKGKTQYTYHVYIHPTEAAAILTLPTRELAVITTLVLPKTKQTGTLRLGIVSYLDRKNKPLEKTSLTISGDGNIEKNSLSLVGEAKFSYPTQTKDMVLKGKLYYGGEHLLHANMDIDVFAKKSQKISLTVKVNKEEIEKGYNITGHTELVSRGQQLKVDLKDHLAISSNNIGFGYIFSYTDEHQKPKSVLALFSASHDQAHLLVTTPNEELIRSDVKLELSKNSQKLNAETTVLNQKPLVITLESQDFNSFKYLQYQKGSPDKITANGRIVLGQLAEVHADVHKDGEKKNLFSALIHLDDSKFLKSDFNYNKENIESVIKSEQKLITEVAKQLKDVSNEVGNEIVTELKDFFGHLNKAQPNFAPLIEYYSKELSKLNTELNTDQTLQEISTLLKERFAAAILAISEHIKQLNVQLQELQKQYNEIVAKMMEVFQQIYPQLKESFNKLLELDIQILKLIGDLVSTYVKALLNLINAHQKELKQILDTVTELTQDIAKVLLDTAEKIRKYVQESVTTIVNQAKALPIYDTLKKIYHNVLNAQISDSIIGSIEDICKGIKPILPTQELQEFFQTVYDYLLKHLKHQQPDDVNEIKTIYTRAISALKSIVELLHSNTNLMNLPNFFETRLPFSFGSLPIIPSIPTLKLSILNLWSQKDLPSPFEVYRRYKPTAHLSDIVPPFSKVGIIIDGGYVFTFDGKYLALPGSCSYILAQDIQDGNFSVVANLQNGNLISITITEPKESMTITKDGNLLVNNKPADYPASTKNLHAYLVNPLKNIKSDYGVHLICSEGPLSCALRVSGFYIGKLRGLFGDANNEPYDDYTLPSGKITEDATEFGNAYKLKTDCPAATAVQFDSSQPRVPVCTEYFTSSNSPLSPCFKYVDPAPYRQACDHYTKSNKEGQCLFSLVYYGMCTEHRAPRISIPSSCTKCTVGQNTIAVGDSFSVKIPNKEVDIVFVVEQEVQNQKIFKELISTLMAELREELKQHGITDTHIGLIGFGEHMKWPQHYTSGGSLNIQGEVKNMKFDGKYTPVTLQEAKDGNTETKLEYLQHKLNVELSNFHLTDAFKEIINYPFRPAAAKAVISVLATSCEKSVFPVSLQYLRILLALKHYRDHGLTYYHIYFPNDILVSGKPQKNIVGYDKEVAYTFADSKEKPLHGSSEIKENMVLSKHDNCAEFALTTGGAAFSSNNFLDAKPNQKKQFIQVATRKIVNKFINTEIQEDCLCEQYHGIIGRSHCKIVNRREK